MRISDLNPSRFCDVCLKKQHRAVHRIEEYLRNKKHDFNKDVVRWKGHEDMLSIRHELIAAEMEKRHIIHKSPLKLEITGISAYPESNFTDKAELEILRKSCPECAERNPVESKTEAGRNKTNDYAQYYGKFEAKTFVERDLLDYFELKPVIKFEPQPSTETQKEIERQIIRAIEAEAERAKKIKDIFDLVVNIDPIS